MNMQIVKVINNNLVKSFNEKNQEVLVMGCGLGFKKKQGDPIEEALIEKIYTSEDRLHTDRLSALLAKVPFEHVKLTNKIISYAKVSLGKKLSDNIYLTLTDHISFALERVKSGIVVKNAFLWEIKRFYNHEFLIGKEALALIKKNTGIELPEDEAGFIAMHLVNATMDITGIEQVSEMAQSIQHIVNIVKYHFHMELDEYSLHYERFITHLKFFVQRIFHGTELNEADNGFLTMLKEQYKNEYSCALKIREYIQKEFQIELTENELIYLTIHIKRITI